MFLMKLVKKFDNTLAKLGGQELLHIADGFKNYTDQD